MSISASDVMELRRRTGAGMMECKKFLVAADGDMEKAIVDMRKSGQAKADKKASRTAAEGAVVIALSKDGKKAAMVEVNSETDFVARDESFTTFANAVADTVLTTNTSDVDALNAHTLSGASDSVETQRQALVAKLGENIKIRRAQLVDNDGAIGFYVHGNRIGVIAALKNGDADLAKGIAMHIAASKPLVVSRDQVPQDAIDNEREIFMAQAQESGKPQEIIEKMVEGRIAKFIDEVSLSGQAYVRDPNKKVGQLLQEENSEVLSFIRFEVGEGIEKKEDNFVEEVMAQVREQDK